MGWKDIKNLLHGKIINICEIRSLYLSKIISNILSKKTKYVLNDNYTKYLYNKIKVLPMEISGITHLQLHAWRPEHYTIPTSYAKVSNFSIICKNDTRIKKVNIHVDEKSIYTVDFLNAKYPHIYCGILLLQAIPFNRLTLIVETVDDNKNYKVYGEFITTRNKLYQDFTLPNYSHFNRKGVYLCKELLFRDGRVVFKSLSCK